MDAAQIETIETIEADELWTYVEKKETVGLWWAIDRATRRALGWALGDRNTGTGRALGQTLPRGDQLTYATDHWQYYRRIFPKALKLQDKAHTYTIETVNNRIRCYLARLRRKTHRDTKSRRNVAASILFYLQRKCGAVLLANAPPARNAAVLSSIYAIPI